jgi:hypothetical protein
LYLLQPLPLFLFLFGFFALLVLAEVLCGLELL